MRWPRPEPDRHGAVPPRRKLWQVGPSAYRRGSFFLHHHLALPPWFGFTLTAVVCGAAFWRGGREEQSAAGALVLAWVATLVFRDPRWVGTQWAGFTIDLVLLTLLTLVSLRSARWWPMLAAGFQLLNVITHVARMVDPGVRAWAYATGQVIWSQLVLVALGVGVINAWRRTHAIAREMGRRDV